jgi:class 3 adenylate cyclase
MQLTATLNVEASPEQVLAVISDPVFIAFASERAKMRLIDVDVNQLDSGALTLVIRRTAEADMIPANFRSFVGSQLELRQTEAWAEPIPHDSSERYGTFDLEVVGAPVRIAGRIKLSAADRGSVLTYSGEVSASIPLFGATIEKAVGKAITEVLESEEELINNWIHER